MDCTTKHINPITKLLEDKPKKPFATNELAIKHCSQVNKIEGRIHKVVPYKCPICHQFHVGRNGKLLTPKYVNKLTKTKPFQGFKIIGKIDL